LNDLGRKVFFVYPPSVVKEDLITHLIDNEYETYMVKDTRRAELLFEKYDDAICFVNIDTGFSEPEWETWIRKILAEPKFSKIGIGIVSYNSNEKLQKKYLMDIGIQCGYIKLKLGRDESIKILLATLNANEAKGRRKYVRADATGDTLSSLNFTHGRLQIIGKIVDISVVGFACILDPDPELAKNMLLSDVQLKLRASLLRTDLILLGSRPVDDRNQYIFLFPPKIENHAKAKIRTYIQTTLQASLEQYLEEAIKNAPKEAQRQSPQNTSTLLEPAIDKLEELEDLAEIEATDESNKESQAKEANEEG